MVGQKSKSLVLMLYFCNFKFTPTSTWWHFLFIPSQLFPHKTFFFVAQCEGNEQLFRKEKFKVRKINSAKKGVRKRKNFGISKKKIDCIALFSWQAISKNLKPGRFGGDQKPGRKRLNKITNLSFTKFISYIYVYVISLCNRSPFWKIGLWLGILKYRVCKHEAGFLLQCAYNWWT